jgi:hypothetical protein
MGHLQLNPSWLPPLFIFWSPCSHVCRGNTPTGGKNSEYITQHPNLRLVLNYNK